MASPYLCMTLPISTMNEQRITPCLQQNILNATPAWMHRNRLTGPCTCTDWSTALAPDPHGSTRGRRNNDLKLSFSRPPAPPRHTRAPTPHTETKAELLSDRQQQGHMEGCLIESGITVTWCTPQTCSSQISSHTVCMCRGTGIGAWGCSTAQWKGGRHWEENNVLNA